LRPIAHAEDETSNERADVSILSSSISGNRNQGGTNLCDAIEDIYVWNVKRTTFEGTREDDLAVINDEYQELRKAKTDEEDVEVGQRKPSE